MRGEKNPCCFFVLVCLLWLLWCFGGSTVDNLGGDEWCIVVVFFVVDVVSAAFVLVVGFSRARCLFVCCWLGCRSRGDGGCESR